jgi:hypothetical protein
MELLRSFGLSGGTPASIHVTCVGRGIPGREDEGVQGEALSLSLPLIAARHFLVVTLIVNTRTSLGSDSPSLCFFWVPQQMYSETDMVPDKHPQFYTDILPKWAPPIRR